MGYSECSEVSGTKNTDYVIYMTTSGGRTWRYRRDRLGWKQMGPEGQLHRMTAEQVLNHLLPALAEIKRVTVRVDYRPSRKRNPV
jgi:hypothetical protein